MTSCKACIPTALICLLLLSVTADESVHIMSKYNQLVTSSTLNWLPIAHFDPAKEIVIGGFEVFQENEHTNQAEKSEPKERVIFVCRAMHNGVWVTGRQRQDEKYCKVSYLGNAHSYERYDLLENVDSAARVSWQNWDKYHRTPVGAVAIGRMFVARHVVSDDEKKDQSTTPYRFTHYIGTFNKNEKLGTITYLREDGTEGSVESGEILVEAEPISYELNEVKLNFGRKQLIKRSPQILGKTTLVNEDNVAMKVAGAIGYSYNYSVYWGQGHAILKGLNTTITLVNGTRFPNIAWGIEEKKQLSDVHPVEIYLQPGTGVNATLRANYTSVEVPYLGNLVSYYENKTSTHRRISGIRREENLFDISLEVGPIYFLNNLTLVPTTVPPPTTEPPTTTKIISPVTINKDLSSKDDQNNLPNPDENSIVHHKNPDSVNVQSDDGGPLSLKNNVEGTRSGTSDLKVLTSNFLLFLIVVTLNRIT
ncbi:protein unzipped [Cephus cinctus]|uniref:Protein unzipped n=1 Tax=Cephus cinctus TaxID=211228 RepID=A0AAJ7BVK6_CEPCN|nr:protein unzipped [Cephus cinctus]XP_015595024.1 protein unzipped [Cephus cinctus]